MRTIKCKCSQLELLTSRNGRVVVRGFGGESLVGDEDEPWVIAEDGATMSRRRIFHCDRCGESPSFVETQKIQPSSKASS